MKEENPEIVKFYLSNIFQLLDVSQKGIIEGEDFKNFLENFDVPELDPSIFQNLCQYLEKYKLFLFRFRNKLQEIYEAEPIIIENLEFLELIEDKTIFELAEFLQQFEFEIYAWTLNRQKKEFLMISISNKILI